MAEAPAGVLLVAAVTMAALAPAPATAYSDPPSAAVERVTVVRWQEMAERFTRMLAADRDQDGRWILVVPEPAPGGNLHPDSLTTAAHEALTAARDHLAWVASGLLTDLMAAPEPGETITRAVPATVAGELLREPALAEPLRRFTAAALGARGLSCTDCMEGIRPSREVEWKELRKYLEAFIHVRSVDDEGRIDLRVGTLSSSLPELEECDREMGAAAHALMRISALNDSAVRKLIGAALNADLVDLRGFPPEVLRRKLNASVPLRVLTDPLALRPIVARVPEMLDLHGLRCTDCAGRVPRR